MSQLPMDRTRLNAAIANQQPSLILSSQANREAHIEAADTIDLLYLQFQNAILTGSLTLLKTTANITYYVATTGSDTNDGLSVGSPLKNIQTAINKLPQIINHTIIINVAAGTYPETISLNGFMGQGQIIINGATSLAATHNVNDVFVNKVQIPVNITGFNCASTTSDGFTAIGCGIEVAFAYCRSVQTSVGNGFYVFSSRVVISGSQVANRTTGNALLAAELSFVFSADQTTGSGNSTGLQAASGSTIRKSGTQFSGTTAEFAQTGGKIE
ncbi:hypothetical protein PAECIP111893_02376 [Paenibacillus plantiphilus]|uniref:DUF1565 domain-containing protein n=1 Tax=Paenibacillus plantiphilus TaxID=2905650 RepID=A0ABN8GCM8_9BACL|nr:hypothetical protein [Paenibacillus plantiphilus]CAH1205595.1 hypothetical protein PAECIP111893_02376 [Paenibacillus plantiphilus]